MTTLTTYLQQIPKNSKFLEAPTIFVFIILLSNFTAISGDIKLKI